MALQFIIGSEYVAATVAEARFVERMLTIEGQEIARQCGVSIREPNDMTSIRAVAIFQKAARETCDGSVSMATALIEKCGITIIDRLMLPGDYLGIAIWGRALGSYSYYIQGEQARAAKDNAPEDVIYFQEQTGTWRRVSDLLPDHRVRVEYEARRPGWQT